MDSEKTILVKKKDGSFVKMKLSHLKKDSVIKVKPATPSAIVLSTVNKEKEVWDKEDIKSPLEDEELKNIEHESFNKREKEALEIIEKLSFKIPQQAIDNVKNNIVIFLKDIKNQEQLSEILRQPIYLGGADLKDPQLKEIFKIAEEKRVTIGLEDTGPINTLKRITSNRNKLPAKEGEILPSASSPFNAFVHKPAFSKEIKEISSLDDLVENNVDSGKKIEQLIKKSGSVRSTGEDIIPPKNVVFGPVEEIKNFRVEDLRHLSSNSEQAVSRLKQKFINLKEESFILYLQALEAWQQSPIYKNYLEQVCESFNKGKSLKSLDKEEKNLSLEEIKLIIKMEKEI